MWKIVQDLVMDEWYSDTSNGVCWEVEMEDAKTEPKLSRSGRVASIHITLRKALETQCLATHKPLYGSVPHVSRLKRGCHDICHRQRSREISCYVIFWWQSMVPVTRYAFYDKWLGMRDQKPRLKTIRHSLHSQSTGICDQQLLSRIHQQPSLACQILNASALSLGC